MEFNKLLKALKLKAKKLKEEGKLKGFLFKENLYIGLKLEGEEEFIVYYKCPYCGYVGKTKVKIYKNKKYMFELVCENCNRVIERIEKIPMR